MMMMMMMMMMIVMITMQCLIFQAKRRPASDQSGQQTEGPEAVGGLGRSSSSLETLGEIYLPVKSPHQPDPPWNIEIEILILPCVF